MASGSLLCFPMCLQQFHLQFTMLDTKQASLVLQVVPLCQAILYWQTIRILPKILQPLKGIVDYHSFFAALTAFKISKRRRELGNSDFIPLTITPGSSRLSYGFGRFVNAVLHLTILSHMPAIYTWTCQPFLLTYIKTLPQGELYAGLNLPVS